MMFQVSWVKADTRAIQAIGSHKITQNPRIKVMQEKRVKHHLMIINATLEEDGPYMCQLNTPSMKSQVCFDFEKHSKTKSTNNTKLLSIDSINVYLNLPE